MTLVTMSKGNDIPEVKLDSLSYCAIPLNLYFQESLLSTGTGFLYKFDNKTFLITNWHVVTGINPITKKFLNDNGAQPNTLQYVLLKHKNPYILWSRFNRKLYADKEMLEPYWLIHPTKGKQIDVVAIEIEATEGHTIPYINEQDFENIDLFVSDDVFVLGFPYNIKGGGNFPIWKRGSVATEPGLNVDNLPKILIDTASKPGMSGSPVIYRRTGIHNLGIGGILKDDSIIGEIQGFVGIYSGRIIGESDFDAQLGIVWKKEVIEEIIKGGRLDKREDFFC